MKFTSAAALFAAGVSAYANSNVTIVTEIVSEYTTYCPGPTEITHGQSTYTVTEATTLTITDCPCTITHPVTTLTSETETHVAPTETHVAPTETHVAPTETHVAPTEPPVVPTHVVPTGGYNSTIITVPTFPPGTGAPPAATSTPPPAELPSSAGKVVLSGGLLAGLVGLAAFL